MGVVKSFRLNIQTLGGRSLLLIALAAAAPLSLPFLLGGYWLHVIIIGYYYALLAVSWNLVAGYTGQFSFGHVALAGVGAYTSGLLALHFGLIAATPALGILAGGLVAAGTGYLIGTLCLKMRFVYLALTTLAFSEILRRTIIIEYEFTRGSLGLSMPRLFGSEMLLYYYTILGVLVLSTLAIYLIMRSKIGLFLRSIREDEAAAWVMGVDVKKWKLFAFVVSSFMAGIAGGFYGHYLGLVSPTMLTIGEMGLVIAMTVIGGMGSLIGPVIGGVLVEIASEYLREYGAMRLVLFGALIIVVMRFFRGGLWEALKGLRKRLFA